MISLSGLYAVYHELSFFHLDFEHRLKLLACMPDYMNNMYINDYNIDRTVCHSDTCRRSATYCSRCNDVTGNLCG